MFSSLPLKCIDFFPPPLLRNSPLSKALKARNIRWSESEKFNIIFCCHSIPGSVGFVGVGSVPFLFWARIQERPMPARELTRIFRNSLWVVFKSFCISFFSPCKCRCTLTWRWSCLRSAQVHTVGLSLDFWIFSKRPNVVVPKSTFHSNSVGIPSIRFISPHFSHTGHRVGEYVAFGVGDLMSFFTQ